jgi:leucyl aminopeptidase
MQCESYQGDWLHAPSDVLVIGLRDDWQNSAEIQSANEATGGMIARLIESDEASIKPLKVTQVLLPQGIPTKLLVLVGLGMRDTSTTSIFYRGTAAALKSISVKHRSLVRMVGFQGSEIQTRASIAGAMAGCVGQDLFKNEKSLFQPDVIQWVRIDSETVAMGSQIGRAINLTRRLVNLPPNYMYPETMVSETIAGLQDTGVEVEVWDQARLEKERCGALLGVARGSSKEPRLVIMKYFGSDKSSPPIAMVGKGVTFDSGGYSIKPTDGMLTMKCDMAGAATVVGIMTAASKLRVKKNLVGVLGLVENMISGDAMKLGDVLTARNGKTIEIHNTDAEGRLVLADCLDVALQTNPARIVEFATLTGACVVGLGNEISGLMSNNDAWQSEIKQCADECGEYTWPLPMHCFFSELIAGKVADIKNVGEGRYGGAITAAKFLEEFVQQCPWTHIDIAGPAFLDSAKPWCDAGATGTLVRTFVELFLKD